MAARDGDPRRYSIGKHPGATISRRGRDKLRRSPDRGLGDGPDWRSGLGSGRCFAGPPGLLGLVDAGIRRDDRREYVSPGQHPSREFRDAARAIWAGYLAEACLGPAEADGFLLRTVAFSAARLIQSVFEAVIEADRLAGRPVILLQIGANMLAEPERAQVQLYGIPMRSTVS